jgi:hypothetical protein
MSENEGNPESNFPSNEPSSIQAGSFTRDDGLYLDFAHTKHPAKAENIEVFKGIYAHYANQMGTTHIGKPSETTSKLIEEVQHEMEEAKQSYNTMMDISQSIAEAYKDLKNQQ